MEELQDAEIARIKNDLQPDERITMILCQTVGRPDLGYEYVEKLKQAGVPISDDVVISVYNGGILGVVTNAWGEMNAMYIVEKS